MPGSVPLYFSVFFGIAALISLLAHALLSYEQDVRRIAWMGAWFTLWYCYLLAVGGVGLTFSSAAISSLTQLVAFTLLFVFIAECSTRSYRWLLAQWAVFALFYAIIGGTSETFRKSGSETGWLLSPIAWQRALFYVYFCLSGIIRLGALVEWAMFTATTRRDMAKCVAVIIVHMGIFFAPLAIPDIIIPLTLHAVLNVVLLIDISVMVQYAITPLLLTHFTALGSAQQRALEHHREVANRRVAVAEAAAVARQSFLRYVFHEVRVPFNTIVLGLQELLSAAVGKNDEPTISDLRVMKQAADSMQRYGHPPRVNLPIVHVHFGGDMPECCAGCWMTHLR